MKKIIIIGIGNAGSVVAQKCNNHPNIFSEIILANRTIEKAESIQKKLSIPSKSVQVNADNTNELILLLRKENPFLVINMALPYHDLNIMTACLETNTHYIDTANIGILCYE